MPTTKLTWQEKLRAIPVLSYVDQQKSALGPARQDFDTMHLVWDYTREQLLAGNFRPILWLLDEHQENTLALIVRRVNAERRTSS